MPNEVAQPKQPTAMKKQSRKVRHLPGHRTAKLSCTSIDGAPPQTRAWFARMEHLYKLAHLQPFRSQVYIKRMLEIAAMTTLRLDPSIKSTICKACKCLLIPEVTATMRIHSRAPQYTCMFCGAVRVLSSKKYDSLGNLRSQAQETVQEE